MTKEEFFNDRPSFSLLEDKKDLVGVEIGIESGKNAENILEHLSIKKLYLIDPFIHYGGMKGSGVLETPEIAYECVKGAYSRLSKYRDKTEWINMFSDAAVIEVPNELDFVYVDGNHRYEYVKKDEELYYPKLRIGGLMALHDFKQGEPGVQKAVFEFCEEKDLDFNVRNWDAWFWRK